MSLEWQLDSITEMPKSPEEKGGQGSELVTQTGQLMPPLVGLASLGFSRFTTPLVHRILASFHLTLLFYFQLHRELYIISQTFIVLAKYQALY